MIKVTYLDRVMQQYGFIIELTSDDNPNRLVRFINHTMNELKGRSWKYVAGVKDTNVLVLIYAKNERHAEALLDEVVTLYNEWPKEIKR